MSALIERHETFSNYHMSIYSKASNYLIMNMVLIPALTMTNTDPLFNVIFKKDFSITKFLSDFYIANSGIFFVSILIQQACLSSAFYLNNGAEIYFSYFSPWIATERRKILNDSAPWRK